jgi:hypothetical protein
VITIGTFSFAIIKLVLVLHDFHLTKLDLACVYIFLIFSAMELIGSLRIIPYLRKLKLLEQQQQQSIDQTKKQVDISRVLSLAKAERLLITIGILFVLITSAIQIVDVILFGKVITLAFNSQSMNSVNRYIIIVFCLDAVASISSFIHSWLLELAGQ